ncbi:lipopolysaccharide biosynthesis protein [Actinomadura sp. 6N118]|uniref:lipopolysaccharide biosynthesis protein n=1 Tax=Actinomadura sp. 6N118 TaxID=3375151 RepID=UPI0037A07F37
MSDRAAVLTPPATGWLRRELSNPLFRNGYALVLNGGLTTMLGGAFWALGPLWYGPADFGRNFAMNQAIMFVGGATALTFLLIRFIPETARHTRALVLGCYALGTGAAVAVGAGFLAVWGEGWSTFDQLHGVGPGLLFLGMAVAWNLWNAVEGTFMGLRQAGWVPLVNTVWCLLRIGLLAVLAGAFPHNGMVLAWYLPVMVILVPVNLLIFRRLIPAHRRANEGRGHRSSHREIGRYLGIGYLGGAFQFAAMSLVPMMVIAHLTPTATAYFQVAWIAGMMLDLLSINLSSSLTVEGSIDRERLAASTRAVLRRAVTVLVPVSVLVIVAAPFALELYGDGYATGAPLLQILALAVLPKAVLEIYIGVLRVRNRTHLIAALQGVRLAGVLGLVFVVIDPDHLYTIGLAVVAVNVVIAAAVLPGLRKAIKVADGTGLGRTARALDRTPDGPSATDQGRD